jgi:hypothetical protein
MLNGLPALRLFCTFRLQCVERCHSDEQLPFRWPVTPSASTRSGTLHRSRSAFTEHAEPLAVLSQPLVTLDRNLCDSKSHAAKRQTEWMDRLSLAAAS